MLVLLYWLPFGFLLNKDSGKPFNLSVFSFNWATTPFDINYSSWCYYSFYPVRDFLLCLSVSFSLIVYCIDCIYFFFFRYLESIHRKHGFLNSKCFQCYLNLFFYHQWINSNYCHSYHSNPDDTASTFFLICIYLSDCSLLV